MSTVIMVVFGVVAYLFFVGLILLFFQCAQKVSKSEVELRREADEQAGGVMSRYYR